MTKALLLPLPGNERLASTLAAAVGGEVGVVETRKFPDQETYLRLRTDVGGRSVAIVCSLDRPDEKFLPLVFTAGAARDLGAARVGLVAPYLAYMRQDRRFKDGEAITSTHFARLLSAEFDWLVAVDPHLHRYGRLDDVYPIPTRVGRAAPLLAEWIRDNVTRPLIIGPDAESEQWVSAVAARAAAPYVVLRKERFGDRDVEISVPDLSNWSDRHPVLIDDIVSSGRTMTEAARRLTAAGLARPVCAVIHALFSDDAYRSLKEVAGRIVTANTVFHESNGIDVSGLLATEVATLVAPFPGGRGRRARSSHDEG